MAKTGGFHKLRGSFGEVVHVYRCWVRLPVIWKLSPAAVKIPPPQTDLDFGEGSLSDADKSQSAPNPDAGVFLINCYGYSASAILV